MQEATKTSLNELFEQEQDWTEFIELDNFESLTSFESDNPFMQDDLKDYVDMLHAKDYGYYKGSIVINKAIFDKETQKTYQKPIEWVNLGKDSTGVNELLRTLQKFKNQKDVYISINPSKSFKRNSGNIHKLRFLYQDLDIMNFIENRKLQTNFDSMCKEVYKLFTSGLLPKPTMIVNSGRGLHLYWDIGNYVPTQVNINYWLDLQGQLFSILKDYGADSSVSTNYCGVLRVPATLNAKNNKTCRIVEYNKNNIYSLDAVRTYFSNELNKKLALKKLSGSRTKETKKTSKQNKNNVKNIININPFLEVNRNRYDDLLRLIKIRNGDVGNCRSRIILLTTYYFKTNNPSLSDDEILENAIMINELFTHRLPYYELRGYVKGALRFNDKRLCINAAAKRGEEINLNHTRGLNPKNTTIIDWLTIQEEEQMQLKTLHSEQISRELKNVRERKSRRGGDGLTAKQREQMEKRKKAIDLKSQGLSLRKVATEMGISLSTLQNLLK